MNEISIFQSLFKLKRPDEDNAVSADVQLDVDREGKPLFRDDIINFVTDELDRRKQEKLPLENQWRLNSNFLAGNQYCDINVYSGNVEQLAPVYDWLERESFNRIAPLIETRIANLKRIKYLMTVKPRTSEIDDYAKARFRPRYCGINRIPAILKN